MFEIEYEFQEEDLLHFNEIRFANNLDVQQNIKKTRWAAPGVMAIIGSFYYIYYGDYLTFGCVLAIAGLWALLSPRIILMDLQKQVLKNYSAEEKAAMFGTYTLTIDPKNPRYLLEKSPSGSNKMAWNELLRVDYGKRYVYIYLDLTTALVIPVDKVKKGNLEQFAEQAEQMIERLGEP
jgi:hypothetical protein